MADLAQAQAAALGYVGGMSGGLSLTAPTQSIATYTNASTLLTA